MPKSDKTPICVTGASGFVAGHIVERLLREGYDVRGTVRDPQAPKNQYLHSVAAQAAGANPRAGKLTLFAADLEKEGSFDEAFAPCKVVIHTAAVAQYHYDKDPFKEVINPAVHGVETVVKACQKAGVKRIVYTSTVSTVEVAEAHRPPEHKGKPFTEDMWATRFTPKYGTYPYAKITAEKRLDELWKGECIKLLPCTVFGPQQNGVITSSNQIAYGLFVREYPVAPPIRMDWVDARDVAKAHFLAATTDMFTSGERYNVTMNDIQPFSGFSTAINAAIPGAKAPTKSIPWPLLWCSSWFDKRMNSFVLYELCDNRPGHDNSKIKRTGFTFDHTDLKQTMKDIIESFVKQGICKPLA